MGALSIPAAVFAAVGAVGLAYVGALYLWRLLVVAVATSIGGWL